MKKWTEEDSKRADDFLDETEAMTRMLAILDNFGCYDLETIEWDRTF